MGWRKVIQGTRLRVSSTEQAANATREGKMSQGLGVASERTLPEYLRGWAEASHHPQPKQEIKRPLKFLADLH